jgi:multidrug efflux pump subunit AcrA (membrane-fusion protein)
MDAVPSWFTRRRVIVGGVLIALVLGGVLLATSRGAAKADGKDANVPPLVTVIVPVRGSVMSTVSLTGQVSAQNDMPIGVEGDGGRISAVLVEPGDRVHKGQVLARLNPLTAQSQVDSAEASLDELKADAATAKAKAVPRHRSLHRKSPGRNLQRAAWAFFLCGAGRLLAFTFRTSRGDRPP